MLKRMRILFAFLIILLFPSFAHSSDVFVSPVGPVFSLSGLAWGTSGQGGFNNNFFFSPLYTSESVCVFVYNKNPTNAHTFSAQIAYTGNVSSTSPGDGTWSAYSPVINFSVAASPSQAATIGASTSGAGLISVDLTNGSTLAGSPDTANVQIVQTTNGSCMVTGKSTTSGTLQTADSGGSSTSPTQVISDSLSQAFVAQTGDVNPATTTVLMNINGAGTTTRTLYMDRIVVTNTAASASQINITFTSTVGSGCTAVVPLNLHQNSGITQQYTVNFNCTTAPTLLGGSFAIPVTVGGGTDTVVIDMKGWILGPGISNGIMVYNPASITGTVGVSAQWYEK